MIYFAMECISGIIKSYTGLSISTTLERWYFNICICNYWKIWLQFFIIMINFKWINNRFPDVTSNVLYTSFLMSWATKFIPFISGFRICRSFFREVLHHLSLACEYSLCCFKRITFPFRCLFEKLTLQPTMDSIKWIHHHHWRLCFHS